MEFRNERKMESLEPDAYGFYHIKAKNLSFKTSESSKLFYQMYKSCDVYVDKKAAILKTIHRGGKISYTVMDWLVKELANKGITGKCILIETSDNNNHRELFSNNAKDMEYLANAIAYSIEKDTNISIA